MEKTIHQGRNIKRFREMLGIKQEAMAADLGEEWSQRRISLLEQKEVVDDTLLKSIAEYMKLPVEAFRNLDDETAINIISNTFTSNDTSILNAINPYATFNPYELIEENKSLYKELLKEKEAQIALLQQMLAMKQ